MDIQNTAVAGTLESSDLQVTISSNARGIDIDLDSQVIKQYGGHIEELIKEILADYNITKAKVKVVDRGALDCTIKARVITAINRAINTKHADIDWEVL
jgi:citrate lyase subunit gamma (acyl carrier protein)